jgi:PAS domain S-box-containing protein
LQVNKFERLASFLTTNDIAESPWGISRRETRGSDVSEFKQSESDSRGSSPEERLAERTEPSEHERDLVSTVLGIVSAVVLVTDARGRIVRVNKACEDVSGYRTAELHGRFFWDLAPQEDWEAAKHYFEHIVSGRVTELGAQEIRWCFRGGAVRSLSARSQALHDARGQIECVICTAVDITEQRLAEEQVRQCKVSLDTAVRLAQDLSQPLGAIAAYAEAVLLQLRKRLFDSDKLANSLEKIATQVQCAGEILRELRELR